MAKTIRPVAVNNVTSKRELEEHLPGVGPTWATAIFDRLEELRREGCRMSAEDMGDLIPLRVWECISHLIAFDTDVVCNGHVVLKGYLSHEERQRLREQRQTRKAEDAAKRTNKVRYSIRGESLGQNLGDLLRAAGVV